MKNYGNITEIIPSVEEPLRINGHIDKKPRYSGSVLPVLLLTLLFPVMLQAQNPSIEERADSLYQAYKYQEALQLYEPLLAEDPDNFKVVWRLSLLYSRLGSRFDSEEKRAEYYQKAHELAEKALRMDSTSVHSNFAMGMAMGRKALILGPREKVAAARDIYRYTKRALKADDSHPGAWYLLGLWHLEVTNLNFAERLAARYLFGGFPNEASIEKAITCIEKALEINPGFLIYWYDLARAYKAAGKREKALHAVNKALELDPKLPEAKEFLKKSRELKAAL